MRRLVPLVAWCSLTVVASLLASVSSALAAAGARFPFGTRTAITRPIPATLGGSEAGTRFGVNAWTRCGVTLTPATTNEANIQLVFPDGAGGAIIAWSDKRNGDADCFASRLNAGGDFVSGWTGGGNAISVTDSSQIVLAAGTDGAGGVFAVYVNADPQNASFHDAYLQHLTGSGAPAAGYPAGGKTLLTGDLGGVGMLPDGAGGLFFGWAQPPGSTIRAKRLDATGATTGGWPAGGLDTGVSEDASGEPALDGAGGFYFTWATPTTIVIQRFSATGVVSGWPAGGLVIATVGGGFPSDPTPRIVRLSSGDALVAWEDGTTGHVMAQRVTAAGAVHGSWPAGGLQVSSGTELQTTPQLLADGAGGALVLWEEQTVFPTFSFNAYVQRLTATGAISSGWPATGVPVSDAGTTFGPSNLVNDGSDGVVVTWTELGTADPDIYAQHILATGALDINWAPGGLPVCDATGDQVFSVMATDTQGGAIVAFQDRTDMDNPQIRVARLLADGTVSALASLVNASAEAGLVRLHWFTPDGSVVRATVERAEADGAFMALGEVQADGEGHLRFEDRDVVPGATYQYRLAVPDEGAITYLGLVTVRVPTSLAFGIEGIHPNPADRELSVVFALASASPARLELLDVAGRRVLAREVGALGAGQHVLRLDQAKGLPAGIYTVRLTQDGREVVARAAIVR